MINIHITGGYRMKRIEPYLFFTSILILVFMFSFNCFAQSEEKVDYGEIWKSMDSSERVIFFMGVREGMIYSTLDIFTNASASGLPNLSNTQKEQFANYSWEKLSGIQKNAVILIDIITNLYKYPENSYIRFSHMVDIAIKKLQGESIEKLLEKRRKEAYENS